MSGVDGGRVFRPFEFVSFESLQKRKRIFIPKK